MTNGYSLVSDRHSFEREAVDTLIAEMENKRDKIAIVFAGYPKEMDEFLNMNQGLASRINFHIDFDNYDEETLYAIFKDMCKQDKYKLEPHIKDLLLKHFKIAKKQDNFSNGRYVRNIVEYCKIIQTNRVIADETSNQNLIVVEDVKEALLRIESQNQKKKMQIGFAM